MKRCAGNGVPFFLAATLYGFLILLPSRRPASIDSELETARHTRAVFLGNPSNRGVQERLRREAEG
jgi:hypothetical protein